MEETPATSRKAIRHRQSTGDLLQIDRLLSVCVKEFAAREVRLRASPASGMTGFS